MNLENVFLVCFLLGVLLSAVSFLLGNLHFHVHLPFQIHFGVAQPHMHVGHGSPIGSDLSFINFGTITAFLAWFGGVGYLLTRHAHFLAATSILIALAAGFFGAWVVFTIIGKLLMNHDFQLDPLDYDMIGVLGRVSSRIRLDGTGEIVFSQQGARRSAPARTDNGSPLDKGLEVVVTRFERGIAYVRPWDELAGSDSDASTTSSRQ